MIKKLYKRTHYLINKKMQLYYTRMLVFYVCFITLILGLAIWYLNKEYLDLLYNIAGKGTFSKDYIQAIENQFLWKLGLAIIAIAALLYTVGIYTSNKFAGPLYRITKYLNLIGMENHVGPINIRKKDQLQELVKAFNVMINSLELRLNNDLKSIDALRGKISEIIISLQKGSASPEVLKEKMKEIDALTLELSKIGKKQ